MELPTEPLQAPLPAHQRRGGLAIEDLAIVVGERLVVVEEIEDFGAHLPALGEKRRDLHADAAAADDDDALADRGCGLQRCGRRMHVRQVRTGSDDSTACCPARRR